MNDVPRMAYTVKGRVLCDPSGTPVLLTPSQHIALSERIAETEGAAWPDGIICWDLPRRPCGGESSFQVRRLQRYLDEHGAERWAGPFAEAIWNAGDRIGYVCSLLYRIRKVPMVFPPASAVDRISAFRESDPPLLLRN